jgi:hypothetical protein
MFFIVVECFVFEKMETLGLLRSAKIGKFFFDGNENWEAVTKEGVRCCYPPL